LGHRSFSYHRFPLLRKLTRKSFPSTGPLMTARKSPPNTACRCASKQPASYSEAIEEYLKVMRQLPMICSPPCHCDTCAEIPTGRRPLQRAAGGGSPRPLAILVSAAAGRLADLYHSRCTPTRALGMMKRWREKIPDTQQANLAEQRIMILEGIVHHG